MTEETPTRDRPRSADLMIGFAVAGFMICLCALAVVLARELVSVGLTILVVSVVGTGMAVQSLICASLTTRVARMERRMPTAADALMLAAVNSGGNGAAVTRLRDH